MKGKEKSRKLSKADARCNFQKGNRIYYYRKMKTILLKDIIKKIGKDYYMKLLYLCLHGCNKLNILNFMILEKENILSSNTILKFRASLSKNGIVKKLKRNEERHRYLNPCISELGSPNNDWLFDKFKDDIKKHYNLTTE